jgi:osmotically-inducible protein OsmY
MSLSDQALAQQVENAIAADIRVAGLPIVVRAADGEISLKGVVDTMTQKELVHAIVQGIQGVKRVTMVELIVREEITD